MDRIPPFNLSSDAIGEIDIDLCFDSSLFSFQSCVLNVDGTITQQTPESCPFPSSVGSGVHIVVKGSPIGAGEPFMDCNFDVNACAGTYPIDLHATVTPLQGAPFENSASGTINVNEPDPPPMFCPS